MNASENYGSDVNHVPLSQTGGWISLLRLWKGSVSHVADFLGMCHRFQTNRWPVT